MISGGGRTAWLAWAERLAGSPQNSTGQMPSSLPPLNPSGLFGAQGQWNPCTSQRSSEAGLWTLPPNRGSGEVLVMIGTGRRIRCPERQLVQNRQGERRTVGASEASRALQSRLSDSTALNRIVIEGKLTESERNVLCVSLSCWAMWGAEGDVST
ncbi:hypothetical protein DPEC_G00182490 [Dallia pectoralis]|uniref:Uncharacterized protein n=1 Tax=Dallia pectoralis TaxID=75939 RepID=A0ACC2GAR6_DALPE|nr:hypothetical protein DPEC_G00182490 [Dallia pectoralis]